MARRTQSHQPFRGMELLAQRGHQIEPGIRLLVQQDGDVVQVHLDAFAVLVRRGVGLVLRLASIEAKPKTSP